MKLRLTALFTALALLLCSCVAIGDDILDRSVDTDVSDDTSNDVSDEISDGVSDDEQPQELCFDDIEYVRPDFDKLKEYHDTAAEMLANKADTAEFDEYIEAYDDAISYACTMKELLDIKNALDTSNTALADEIDEITELYYDARTDYVLLLAEIAESEYKDAVFDDWTDEDFEYLKKQAAYLSDEFTELQTQYNTLTHSITSLEYTAELDFRGGKATLNEIYSTANVTSKEISKAESDYADVITELYLDIISLGNDMATLAGYNNFAEYAYADIYERDYGFEQVEKMCESIKKYLPEVLTEISGGIFTAAEYNAYKKLATSDVLTVYPGVLKNYLASIQGMTAEWNDMQERGFCHIGSSESQMSNSFTTTLEYFGESYMYIDKSNNMTDLFAVVHEFGHYYASKQYDDSSIPLDVSEMQSQTGEYLVLAYTKDYGIYGKSVMKKYQLSNSLTSLLLSAAIAEFEIYAFTEQDVDGAKLDAKWQKICGEYGIGDTGYSWRDIMHICYCPLYYVSYAVSQIPAIEIYGISLSDKDKATEIYSSLLHYDGKSFTETLDELGLSSPFMDATVAKTAQIISKSIF